MVYLIMVFALLGLFTGSFLNVCIDRLPHRQSIISPPSHCSNCNRKLGILDLIPLVSYLLLRGKCRYCQADIPVRIFIVEFLTGALFAFLYWRFGLTPELGVAIVYSCILIVVFVIDLEHQLVLDKITYPGMLIALAGSFFWPGIGELASIGGPLGKIVSALAGGGIGLVAMGLPFILYPKGMGFGDVKLAALVGFMTGFPLAIMAILLSWIIGGVVASILLLLKVKSRKDPIPSATFLAVSAMIALLWGEAILQWYIY